MISLLLFMITFHVDAPSCSDEAIRRVELSSDLVVQARVVEVGPSLGLWSGGYVVAQRVDYEIEGILKIETISHYKWFRIYIHKYFFHNYLFLTRAIMNN